MAARVRTIFLNYAKATYRHQMHRALSHSSILNGKSLVYSNYGEPIDVLKLTSIPVEKPAVDQVAVRWLLAPVNPADINTIQGKYPSRPALPAVAGNEGVGEVTAVGPNVKDFNVGDRVVPNENNTGTWKTHGTYSPENILKIPKDMGIVEASMLNVNPCTAYRMLKDYVSLEPGDTVIQNGANSAVGQLVIQLCKIWNYKSVNIIRDRPDINDLKSHLERLGSTVTLTDAELRTTDLFKSKKLPAPKLALNCICGQSAVEVLRHLAPNGTMVTYGAMSREPLTVPASALIFKNVSIKGFWMTAWTKGNSNSQERTDMLNKLGELFESKQLEVPPFKLVPLTKYQDAVINAMQADGKKGVKYILDLTA